METGGNHGDDRRWAPLIPGLPDDMAMECLARVPSQSFRPMRQVSQGWRKHVGSPWFRQRREIARATEDIIMLIQVPIVGMAAVEPEFSLSEVNLTTGAWRSMEHSPAWATVPIFSQCASAGDDRHVAVVGGWDQATLTPSREVRVIDFAQGTWARVEQMPDYRSFFGCAGGNGMIYVGGGHDESKSALRSVMAYNVAAKEWSNLPDMREERDELQLVARPGGRVVAASGYPTDAQGAFKRTAESYTAGGGAWSDLGGTLPGGAGTFLTSVGGKLWAFTAGEGGVREWDDAGRAWRRVADGPPGMTSCAKAVGVGDGAAVFVYGFIDPELVELGDAHFGAWLMDVSAARWKRLPMPPRFSHFVYSATAVRV